MYQFTPASTYPWKKGALFLGKDENNNDVGIVTERHAITIAGSQSGKGVGVIIPNLLRWESNVLVIDPKGEAAAATIEKREAMGCPSFVFAPFAKTNKVNVPERYLVTINPLDGIDPESMTITEEIDAISDGLVMRDNPESSHWDDGAQTILSGIIAYVILRADDDRKNLLEVRSIIRNGDNFAEVIEEMKGIPECGGLCEAGASAAYAKEGGYFVSNAEKNTRWLDSLSMQKALTKSTFDMNQIKWGNASLFLVLPSKFLDRHGRFLRLFVRTALETMMEENEAGDIRGNDCLFLLDEFFSLGKINEIAKSAGLMAGYGLKLWPILQDLDQLFDLYGQKAGSTFFGSSDLHQFFGNMDNPSLKFISEKIGNYTPDDLPNAPVLDLSKVAAIKADIQADKERLFGGNPHGRMGMIDAARIELKYAGDVHQENLSRFNQEASRVLGKPRMSPPEIASLIEKPERGPSKHSIAFVHGGKPIIVRLAPYYDDENTKRRTPKSTRAKPATLEEIGEIMKKSFPEGISTYKPEPKPKTRWERLVEIVRGSG